MLIHSYTLLTTMASLEKERSSIGVYADTRERFNDAKPYDSISADEFIDLLLDRWEGRQ